MELRGSYQRDKHPNDKILKVQNSPQMTSVLLMLWWRSYSTKFSVGFPPPWFSKLICCTSFIPRKRETKPADGLTLSVNRLSKFNVVLLKQTLQILMQAFLSKKMQTEGKKKHQQETGLWCRTLKVIHSFICGQQYVQMCLYLCVRARVGPHLP